MGGFINSGLPIVGAGTGAELMNIDTQLPGGASPQSAAMTLQNLAYAVSLLSAVTDRTTVAGTRYIVSAQLGNQVVNGINVKIGTAGGTDKWIVELHDSTGALLMTSNQAGTNVSATANSWQAFPLVTPYLATAGTYYLVVQSNGTAAKLGTVNTVTSPLVTGSATGSFGVGAAITPPTTYTAGLGPQAMVY